MLRKIKTRFFGHGLGYLVAIAWPLSHILGIITIFALKGWSAPYGESTALFIGTGTVPFMTFSYLSRFTVFTVILMRPLLAFPEVKVLDLLFASVLLEALAACCVTIVMIVLAWFFKIDFMPHDVVEAAYAFGASLLLGAGFGLLNGVVALAEPMWLVGYTLIIIALWVSSGVWFVPDALPERARSALSYNPVLQVIEWMRSAYYEGYGDRILDRAYVIEVGVGAVFLGLLLERAMRGHLLAKR